MVRALPLCVVLLAANAARADLPVLEDVLSARSVAMGGAYRAMASSSDSPEGNPATMALTKAYQLSGDGAWDVGTKSWWAGSLVRDSSSSPVAAGVGYHGISSGRGSAREFSSFNTMALATPVLEGLTVGASGHYLIRSGAHPANAATMDAGLALRIGEVFNLSASAHNLIYTRHPEMSRFYALAAAVETGAFNLAVDARSEFGPRGLYPALNGGTEVVLGNIVALRGGYSIHTDTLQQFMSFGAGVTTDQGSLDVSYRHELRGGPGRLLVLSVKMAL